MNKRDNNADRFRRADYLRLQLQNPQWTFRFSTNRWPRWTIDDVAALLTALAKYHDPEKCGCRKRVFKKKEIGQLVFWLLYRSCPPWESHRLTLNHRQSAFFRAYISPGGFNAARAARAAGYSHRRARQTGHELRRKLRGW